MTVASAGLLLAASGCATAHRPPPEPPPASAGALLQERYAAVREAHEDSAVSGLAWMMRHWHKTTCATGVADAVGARLDERYPIEDALVETAAGCGLWAFPMTGNMNLLAARVAADVPVMVQLQDGPRDSARRRFMVVTGYDRVSGRVTGIGADGGVVAMDESELWRTWSLRRFWMMTVCPPDAARWNMVSNERLGRVRFLDAMGLSDRADAEAAQALLLAPENADLMVTLAIRERARGRSGEAERLLRQALAQDPHEARAANNLAFILAEREGPFEEAMELARRALLLEPTNPRMLDTLGFVQFRQGKYAEAAATLERALGRARDLSDDVKGEIGLRLATAHARAGHPDLARQVLTDLRHRQPGLLVPAELQELLKGAP